MSAPKRERPYLPLLCLDGGLEALVLGHKPRYLILRHFKHLSAHGLAVGLADVG